MDKFSGQFSSSALSSKSSCFMLEMPKNACNFSIITLLRESYCFRWGSTCMKFNIHLIIQFCLSLINWVAPRNWCFQAQVLKEITFSYVMWMSHVWVPSWMGSTIWRFAAPQEKEMSSRTTLQSLTWVRMDTEGTIGGTVEFFRSFELSQCFDKLDLFILFRTICFNSAQVKMFALSCLANRIRLLIFTKLPQL